MANLTDWVRHHDKYGNRGFVDSTGRYVGPRGRQTPVAIQGTYYRQRPKGFA